MNKETGVLSGIYDELKELGNYTMVIEKMAMDFNSSALDQLNSNIEQGIENIMEHLEKILEERGVTFKK